MSPFDFGKNFLEEQALVIKDLERRFLSQKISRQELMAHLDSFTEGLNQDQLFALIAKIRQWNIPVQTKDQAERILLQTYQNKIVDESGSPLFSSRDKGPEVRVFHEWDENDPSYDIEEWYENINFSPNNNEVKETSNSGLVSLSEDFDHSTEEKEMSSELPTYEGVEIVVPNKDLADELKLQKFSIDTELEEDTFPYEYVDKIVGRLKEHAKKKKERQLHTPADTTYTFEEHFPPHIDENTEKILDQKDVSSFTFSEEGDDTVATMLDIRDETGVSEEESFKDHIKEDLERLSVMNFNTPESLLDKKEQEPKIEPLVIPSLFQETLETSATTPLNETDNLLKDEDLSNMKELEVLDEAEEENIQEIENFEELHKEEPSYEEDMVEPTSLSLEENVISGEESQDHVQHSEAEEESVLEDISTKEEPHDINEIEKQEPKVEKEEIIPHSRYWWEDAPVIEYESTEDFGSFVLYRDLG